jgi:hypothetical protein
MIGALLIHKNIKMPVCVIAQDNHQYVMAFRAYMTDEEIQTFVPVAVKPSWYRILLGDEIDMQVVYSQDGRWSQMLVEFQTPIYEVVSRDPRNNPVIRCTKQWARQLVKNCTPEHVLGYEYEGEPVYHPYPDTIDHVRTVNFHFLLNNSPIEIVEGDGIWAQYQVGSLRLTSSGYNVKVEEIEGA